MNFLDWRLTTRSEIHFILIDQEQQQELERMEKEKWEMGNIVDFLLLEN